MIGLSSIVRFTVFIFLFYCHKITFFITEITLDAFLFINKSDFLRAAANCLDGAITNTRLALSTLFWDNLIPVKGNTCGSRTNFITYMCYIFVFKISEGRFNGIRSRLSKTTKGHRFHLVTHLL